MPPRHLQVERPSTSLKRRRASSAPCEDEAIRNSKRSRSDVDRSSIKPFLIHGLQGDESLNNEINEIDKGKATPKPSPEIGCLTPPDMTLSNKSVIEELAGELRCGCCTELCYNPVVVNPCQHYFCGSCCVLWVQHGGTNCPACRGVSTSVVPSRVVQAMISMLLRLDPSKARTEGERTQADKVYKSGTPLILPAPRPKSPEPNLEAPNDNLARPCPTCLPGNPYGWQCPVPIQDPIANPDGAFDLDDGSPPGHAFCGNCDQLHNVGAPTTTKCDFCQVSFCGIEIPTRCCALGLISQQAQGLSDISDIIVNGTIYERFNENNVEVDIMVDYLRASHISLRSVYRDIVSHFMKHPQAFTALIDNGAFDDIHNVSGSEDPDPAAPRRRICRLCAAQVLIYGLKGWWIRERRRAKISGAFTLREDCQHGESCARQADPSHAKEFNHIIVDPYDASTTSDANAGPVASNSNSGPSGSSSSRAGHEQSPNGAVSRPIPFSILMPFPIPQPMEGVEADEDIFPPPVPEHNNDNISETAFPGTGYMTISFPFDNTNSDGGRAVRDDEGSGSSSGQAIVAQNTQHGVGSDFPEEQVASGLPTSGGNMIPSSSLLSPVFPTST